jgi:hypothetical protein
MAYILQQPVTKNLVETIKQARKVRNNVMISDSYKQD